MSATHILRAMEPVFARVESISTSEDGVVLLSEAVMVLAQQVAEIVFVKVQGDPDWTPQAIQNLIDDTYHRLALSLTDTLHAHGATQDMALSLTDEMTKAYAGRLRELRAGVGAGGSA